MYLAGQKNFIDENQTLKCNSKIYYCTFSPIVPKSYGTKRNHSRTKFLDSSINNQFISHSAPKFAKGTQNFFEVQKVDETKANKSLDYVSTESPFFYKSDLEARELPSFQLEKRPLENHGNEKFRPTIRSVGTITNASEMEKRHLSMETKFLKGIDSDESTTYGLINHCRENRNGCRREKKLPMTSTKRLNTNDKSTQNTASTSQSENKDIKTGKINRVDHRQLRFNKIISE